MGCQQDLGFKKTRAMRRAMCGQSRREDEINTPEVEPQSWYSSSPKQVTVGEGKTDSKVNRKHTENLHLLSNFEK